MKTMINRIIATIVFEIKWLLNMNVGADMKRTDFEPLYIVAGTRKCFQGNNEYVRLATNVTMQEAEVIRARNRGCYSRITIRAARY